MVGAYGWRSLFFIAGAIGIVFGLVMYGLYREPHESRRVNEAELEHIRAGGGLAGSGAAPSVPFSWANVRRLMSQRQIVGASIGQFCGNSTLVFFLTWFPTYLATERGMDWLKSGIYAVLPYIAASVGRAARRVSLRHPSAPHRVGQHCPQIADRRGAAAGLDHHRRELCRR